MMQLRTKFFAAAAFALFLLFVVPMVIEISGRWDFYYTLTSVALLSIASAGVWLTFYIGRINIGQGAFALFGGYASAILVVKYGVSFWVTIPLAGLFCVLVALVIGFPILRLRGVYFAMVTLVMTEVARLTALALPITNGAKGISSIPLPGSISLFGVILVPDFSTLENVKLGFYYVAVVLMLLTFAGMYRLVNSRVGHLCRSLQQNEELASSIGVNIANLRLIAFSISSFLGGIAGAIFVPMLGTLVNYFGWDLLFSAGEYQLLIYSTLLIGLMLTLPNGLLSIFSKAKN